MEFFSFTEMSVAVDQYACSYQAGWCYCFAERPDAIRLFGTRFRNSSDGSSHSSPFSTMASIEASRFTTVQIQHPKRMFPHDGVVVSTTSDTPPPGHFDTT
jgi:hypothetical protein